MCSVSESSNELKVLNTFENIVLTDIETNKTYEKQSLVQKNDNLSKLDNVLCEKFGISKSKVEAHRKDLLEAASSYFQQNNSKIADTINIEHSSQFHIGHIVNITEKIVLNTENNELEIPNKKKDYKDFFQMIDRMHWLAQPSVAEKTIFDEPVRYIIICHTATEEAFTQAENILMLRLLQTFHIESQGWADIAYNFCIGSDGNAYEGRGWFIQGSHTLHYNKYALGIAFIGCFLNNLPPPQALKTCKDLIAHGVKIGAIRPDYQLLAHSQCRPFESPGKRLRDEIKTWKHYNADISIKNPGIPMED